MRLGRQDRVVGGEIKRDSEKKREEGGGGRATNYQAAVSCYRVTDVLLTSAVAFCTLNTDVDR